MDPPGTASGMASSSASYHEPPETLPPAVRDRHRAIVSLMEELEAVDWYEQRISSTSDPELAAILRHNADEEKEHAAMLLEWLRRTDDEFHDHLVTYLFTDGPITEREESSSTDPATAAADLGLGKTGADE